jgi:hypothetical protein
MWSSPQTFMQITIWLCVLTIKCCQTEIQINSKCGDSFDQEEISPFCKPKLCGIRTWSLNNVEDILEEAKTLTNIIFENDSFDSG